MEESSGATPQLGDLFSSLSRKFSSLGLASHHHNSNHHHLSENRAEEEQKGEEEEEEERRLSPKERAPPAATATQRNKLQNKTQHSAQHFVPSSSNATTSLTHHFDKSFFAKFRTYSASTTTSTPISSVIATRPHNLEPKKESEHLKHLQQYEEMLRKYKKREKQKARELQKFRKAKLEKEDRLLRSRHTWQTELLPNWDQVRNTRKAKDMLWQGVPPKVRSSLWPLSLGNKLGITQELYDNLLQKSPAARQRLHERGLEKDECDNYSTEMESFASNKESTVHLITLDLPRTFPCLSFFQEGGPSHVPLAQVLEAYVCFRPEVGYVQGMSYLAAVLLLYLDPLPAFTCLATLLDRPLLLSFYRMDMNEIAAYTAVLNILMEEFLPNIAKHLRALEIDTNLYIMDWFLTLFSKSLSLDVATRVWDLYFEEGDLFLFRTALGLLSLFSSELLQGSFDECLQLLTHLPSDLDGDALFKCIAEIKPSDKRWIDLLAQFHLPTDTSTNTNSSPSSSTTPTRTATPAASKASGYRSA
ncbi:TBC1 domain family member 14 [Balamuthia mandrillaris]